MKYINDFLVANRLNLYLSQGCTLYEACEELKPIIEKMSPVAKILITVCLNNTDALEQFITDSTKEPPKGVA